MPTGTNLSNPVIVRSSVWRRCSSVHSGAVWCRSAAKSQGWLQILAPRYVLMVPSVTAEEEKQRTFCIQ
jgi:hypothetical protein